MRTKLSLVLIVIYALHWTNCGENGSTDFFTQATRTGWLKLAGKVEAKHGSIDMPEALAEGNKVVNDNTDSNPLTLQGELPTTTNTTTSSPSTLTTLLEQEESNSTAYSTIPSEVSSTGANTTTSSPSTLTTSLEQEESNSTAYSTTPSEVSSTGTDTTTSSSPTPTASRSTAASSSASISVPSQTETQIVNGNYTLNGSLPVTIQFNVSASESLQFKVDVLSDDNTIGVTVKAAMCEGNQDNAWNIPPSKGGLYEISTGMISNMTQEFCADKRRLRDANTETNIFSLYIFGENFTKDETIHVEGTAIESTSTESHSTNIITTVSTSIPPEPSKGLELGWIVAIILGCLLIIAVVTAVGIFLYYCQRNRKVSHEEQEAIWKRPSFDDKPPYRSAFAPPMNVYDMSMAGRAANSNQIYNQRASDFSGAAYDFAQAPQSQPMRLPNLSKQPDFSVPLARNLGNPYGSLTGAQGQSQVTNDLYGYSAGTNENFFPRFVMQAKADRYPGLRN